MGEDALGPDGAEGVEQWVLLPLLAHFVADLRERPEHQRLFQIFQ